MAARTALLLSFVAGAKAHGYMTLPQARQPGAPGLDLLSGHCSKCWFTNGVSIPGKPTLCDRELLTNTMAEEGKQPCTSSDKHQDKPWRAPGTAPISSPCGDYSGQDGTKLPPTARTLWQRGTSVEVAEAITANHGGGYAYRLCPVGEALTESCFQSYHLAFADNMTTVRYADGRTLDIPAIRTAIGTFPAGSQWTRNPIPKDTAFFPAPFPGGSGGDWPFSLIDRVVLPKDLSTGDWVLSWRWDCEGTNQIWANCADVTIVDSMPAPSPFPAPLLAPSPTAPVPAPPTPAPVPSPPAPSPSVHPTCCWSKWGDSTTCSDCPSSGGLCNTDWSKTCNSDSDCKASRVLV